MRNEITLPSTSSDRPARLTTSRRSARYCRAETWLRICREGIWHLRDQHRKWKEIARSGVCVFSVSRWGQTRGAMVTLRFHSPLSSSHDVTRGISHRYVGQARDTNVVRASVCRVETQLRNQLHSDDQRLQPGLSRRQRPDPIDNDVRSDPGRGRRNCVGVTEVECQLAR